MLVKEIMTTRPFCVEKTESIQMALGKMVEYDIRHLPVTESGNLVGIVSDRDIRDYALPLSTDFQRSTDTRAKLDAPVATIMSSSVVTIHEEEEVADLIELMLAEKLSAVPVLGGTAEKLVGIVSYLDVLEVAKV
jgi:acetoin utilization protein AcuB